MSKIIFKKSSVVNKVPLTSDLEYGEVALNYADGKMYYKTSANTIDYIASSAFANVLITSPSNDQILAYDSASGKWINKTVASATDTAIAMAIALG